MGNPQLRFVLPIALALGMLLSGCATIGGQKGQAPAKSVGAPAPSAVTRVAAHPFADPASAAASRASLVVRVAAPEEQAALRERLNEANRVVAPIAGLSAGSLAIGLAANGAMYTGGLIVGGIVLLPMSIAMYAWEHHTADSLEAALASEALVRELRDALPTGQALGTASLAVEVIEMDFGLIERDSNEENGPLCLVADLDIMAKRDGVLVYEETLFVQPYVRSADAPAPFCRAYERWGKHEAATLIHARKDLARSLAAMVRARLTTIDWSE